MRIHHTKDKGDLGVFHAQADLAERGFHLLLPRTEHAPFDLVAYDGSRFYRVQVKYRAIVNGCVAVQFSTVWSDRHGAHKRPIDKDEVDVICIYCPETRCCYYVDPARFGKSVTLRITPARNHQSEGVLPDGNYREFPPLGPHAAKMMAT